MDSDGRSLRYRRCSRDSELLLVAGTDCVVSADAIRIVTLRCRSVRGTALVFTKWNISLTCTNHSTSTLSKQKYLLEYSMSLFSRSQDRNTTLLPTLQSPQCKMLYKSGLQWDRHWRRHGKRSKLLRGLEARSSKLAQTLFECGGLMARHD